MRVIGGIVCALIFALLGAFAAGPAGDWLMALPHFDSPDQHAHFDFAVRIALTAAAGLVGVLAGILMTGRLIRR